jgi:hypothetical protein
MIFSFLTLDPRKPNHNAKAKGSGGRDKFREIEDDIVPPPIEVWTGALSSVIRDPSRIQPSSQLVKGYRFPDPNMFVGTSRRATYLTNWLSSRSGWMQAVGHSISPAEGEAPHPSSQMWRDWLHQASEPVSPSAACPPSKVTMSQKRKDMARKLFKAHLHDTSIVETVFWREQQIPVASIGSLAPHITAEILWDLFENNFRLELLALDRVVVPFAWKGQGAFDRDRLIRSVFPDDAYISNRVPDVSVGLASESVKDRRPYVEAFRSVVSSWPNAPRGLAGGSLGEDAKVQNVLMVEHLSVYFYCQTFFDHVGRAPVVPHRIPIKK